jgi:hypothetical protein
LFETFGYRRVGLAARKLPDALAQAADAFGLVPDMAVDHALVVPSVDILSPGGDEAVNGFLHILPVVEQIDGPRFLLGVGINQNRAGTGRGFGLGRAHF